MAVSNTKQICMLLNERIDDEKAAPFHYRQLKKELKKITGSDFGAKLIDKIISEEVKHRVELNKLARNLGCIPDV